MQTIKRILMIDGSIAQVSDEYGIRQDLPDVVIGSRVKLEYDVRSTETEAETDEASGILKTYPLSAFDDVASYYFALDGDFDQTTTPKMLSLNDITVATNEAGRTILTVILPNTDNPAMRTALSTKETIELKGEIGGLNADTEKSFAWLFPVSIRNCVYIAGDPPADDPDNEYYTALETEAAIGRQLVFEYSENGVDWHSRLNSNVDAYQRVKHGSSGVARTDHSSSPTGLHKFDCHVD